MATVLHTNFTTDPYWWDGARPDDDLAELPAETDVVIIGSGYCGLSAATELARRGRETLVLEAGALGSGASTRSGGMVSSGQKLLVSGALAGVAEDAFARMIEDSIASFSYLKDIIAREALDADLQIMGRFFGAHSPGQYRRLQEIGAILASRTGASVHDIARAQQRGIVGSDYFYGGILVDDYGGLHPGKYHRALRQRAEASDARLRSQAPVLSIVPEGGRFRVRTGRGDVMAGTVVVTTNGYTGAATPDLARRVVPVRSYQIATEPLDADLLCRINPGRRMITDTKRDLFYARPSPDGTRMIFGTRPSAFELDEAAAAPRLHAEMCKVWPELGDARITHCWSGNVAMTFDKTAHIGVRDGVHYALGCNGNGVALMTYLGYQLGLKLAGGQSRPSAFDRPSFPTHPLYRKSRWFLPVVAGWSRLRDHSDRWFGL